MPVGRGSAPNATELKSHNTFASEVILAKEEVLETLRRSSTFSFGTGSTGARARAAMWLLLAEQEDAQLKLPAAQLDCLWAKYDCDKDGSLSRLELARLIQDCSCAMKEHIEKVAIPRAREATVDAISKEATVAVLQDMARRFSQTTAGPRDDAELTRTFEKIDLNRDGRIDREEWEHAVSAHFLSEVRATGVAPAF